MQAKNRILHLLDLTFLPLGTNAVLIGNPGVGKTFLARVPAWKACQPNQRVLFTTAMDMLNHLPGPGGVLVTCSCSHHVSEALLLEVVADAALDCGRTLRILERRTQAQDHPILLTVPETLYLKAIILQVV